ncbi:MAG TPA: MFS transporter [Terriglobales bacterium]|nr:MFS transporter [Terriglobales bacterium]
MRTILQKRELRYVFTANMISMLGSGMNSAAVTWFILQATHSEMALGTLVVLQTLPAMVMLPFTGVIIDREDRRHLVMALDAIRALMVVGVASLAFLHRVHVWELYLMNMLVSAGFWMFWPTITALIQELTPDSQFVHANTFLLAGVQGGWLIAGALVGFAYNHIGLGGVLLIDFATYVVSFSCYFALRKGKRTVAPRQESPARAATGEGSWDRYWRELGEGIRYLRGNRYVVLVGASWAMFIGAMSTQGVVTAPLSDRLLHAGAVGYGWLNAGWGVGAFLSVLYAPQVIRRLEGRRTVAVSMALLASSIFMAPYSRLLALAVALYALMGSARGVGGIAISSSMMEQVPQHFMGRVQNTFYFAGTVLQVCLSLIVGAAAHRIGLALGFALIACVYFVAFLTAAWPLETVPRLAPGEAAGD